MRLEISNVTHLLERVGNPEATISVEKQNDTQMIEKKLASMAIVLAERECFVEVTEEDCGCIDGRCSHVVIYLDDEGVLTEHEKDAAALTRHNRAKVAGGGYLTSTAMDVAIYGHSTDIETNMRHASQLLTKAGVVCGAHIGDHENSVKTDCGANDKMLPIYARACDNKDALKHNMKTAFDALGYSYDEALCETVFDQWQSALNDTDYVASDNPRRRMEIIRDDIIPEAQAVLGKEGHPAGVVYKLKGDHNELFIIFNNHKGVTLSQRILARELANELDVEATEAPKAFCVDVWRVGELAEAFADNTSLALHAGMLYQMATGAELTDGSLPVVLAE